jgi:polyribonucleotide nucleotidyltransferase
LKEGQQVLVKVINIDPTGKIRLSRKALLGPDEGTAPPPSAAGEGGEAGAEAAATGDSAGNRDSGERRQHRDRGGRDRGPRGPRRDR